MESPPKVGIFLGEMQRHMSHEEKKKDYFAAARLFWPEGCLRDFFGLKKAEGLLKAKKIPKTARRPKQAWLKQNKIFFLPNDEKCRALTLKCHFFKYSKLFPLQKVKFLVPKIPIGEKSFLCC